MNVITKIIGNIVVNELEKIGDYYIVIARLPVDELSDYARFIAEQTHYTTASNLFIVACAISV
jgi:translation elongation factor EF-G